jgi:glycosyltransferase involved in cell wall biosynthesis
LSTPNPSLLSFILPVHEPDLILFEKVLKALTVQSLRQWEAIFVLDGPNEDAERAIHRAFKKVPNRYEVVTIPHGGAQKARNAGRPHAKGNYLVWFDSDCVIEPHAALAWVELLDQNPDTGFIYSGYEFQNEMGAIASEPFDPWTLRVKNYISACFPVRAELAGEWDESLESAQDWDFWLSVVERGGKGMYLSGYAFSTAYPTPKSISGKGCAPENWLARQDKVKAKHGIPIREVCVTSLHERMDAIALAKAIDADYDDRPNDKNNHYKTIIQIGFSVNPGEFERCASVWGKQHKKVIFWTADDVEAIHDTVSLRALSEYAPRINQLGKQFVEDKAAQAIMLKAGFTVEVLPLPVISKEEVLPLPEKPKFLVDYSPTYAHVLNAIQRSIPDIELAPVGGVQDLSQYTGLVCFRQDRMLKPSVKRMMAAGRHVLSNIQSPFTGFLNDRVTDAAFMREFVTKIRGMVKAPQSKEQVRYWIDPRRVNKVKEALCA